MLREALIGVTIAGVTALAREAKPANAGGGCSDLPLPCMPDLVKTVDTPQFTIEAYHDGDPRAVFDLVIRSKTKDPIIGLIPTNRGANEAKTRIQEECGPNGDNSLVIFQGRSGSEQYALHGPDCLDQVGPTTTPSPTATP